MNCLTDRGNYVVYTLVCCLLFVFVINNGGAGVSGYLDNVHGGERPTSSFCILLAFGPSCWDNNIILLLVPLQELGTWNFFSCYVQRIQIIGVTCWAQCCFVPLPITICVCYLHLAWYMYHLLRDSQ